VLKRVVLFFLLIGLFGCSNRLTDSRIEVDNQKYDIMDYDVIKRSMGEEDSLVVGVLLPLTGKASSIGTGMQNAMFMALDDLQNDKLGLKFYDTKSSSSGASDAMSKAL
jgi:ABC-type branched-subunit amino acid transport system substrate-binding protein